ncbi:hypothetical protein [Paraclostridium sordellii]|uniref:hypothetical protein n=1 Tax=Paraclostridium sordellii TaxID=1505 RepID=UPI0005DB8872|nr:hypothetical protein [Paeniclostridium sordellii]CEQ18301.1 Uncharacterised protein [[Clostridium] sordellii] [Paeniclostridium sordellii]
MKRSTIIGITLIGIVSTSSIAFANDIKVFKKSGVDYIPLKQVIQKSGGEIYISDNNSKININGKKIAIDKNFSFVRFNDNYYPLNTKKINGIEVPVDTKPIFEKDEVYIEEGFLKKYNIVDYKIEKDNIKIILNGEKKSKQNVIEEKTEENNMLDNKSLNDNLKQSNEVDEIKTEKKVQRASKQKKSEKTYVQTKPDINVNGNIDNNLESDKKDIEKPTVDTKPEEIKKENESSDESKEELPNEQQPQGQLE